MSDTTNSTLISLGHCTRLALLSTNLKDLRERTEEIHNSITFSQLDDPDLLIQSCDLLDVESQIALFLPSLLQELIGVLESIVLSDKIFFLRGHSLNIIEKIRRDHDFYIFETFSGWSHFYGDLNNIFDFGNFFLADLKASPVYLDDEKFAETDTFLDSQRHYLVADYLAAFSDNGLNYDMFKWLLDDDRWLHDVCRNPNEETAAYQKRRKETKNELVDKLTTSTENFLEEDWKFYKDHIWKEFNIPLSFRRQVSGRIEEPDIKLQELSFVLSLFAELKMNLKMGSISPNGFANRNYYSIFANQELCKKFDLMQIISRDFSIKLEKHFEEVGLTNISLTLPPIARMCLSEANNIMDALKRAKLLRQTLWATRLRGYLAELINEKNPLKLLKQLKRLADFQELKFNGLGSLIDSGIGFSTTGAVSLSIPGMVKKFLAWRNPSILVNTELLNALGNQDSITDLCRILDLPSHIIVSALTNFNKINENTTLLPKPHK